MLTLLAKPVYRVNGVILKPGDWVKTKDGRTGFVDSADGHTLMLRLPREYVVLAKSIGLIQEIQTKPVPIVDGRVVQVGDRFRQRNGRVVKILSTHYRPLYPLWAEGEGSYGSLTHSGRFMHETTEHPEDLVSYIPPEHHHG